MPGIYICQIGWFLLNASHSGIFESAIFLLVFFLIIEKKTFFVMNTTLCLDKRILVSKNSIADKDLFIQKWNLFFRFSFLLAHNSDFIHCRDTWKVISHFVNNILVAFFFSLYSEYVKGKSFSPEHYQIPFREIMWNLGILWSVIIWTVRRVYGWVAR